MMDEIIIPGHGNDFPSYQTNPAFAAFLDRFCGIGYEFRIMTKLFCELDDTSDA